MNSPLPLIELDHEAVRDVRYVLTDFDDTLTLAGQLPAATLQALYRLQEAGIGVIPVTGGCAGWSDMMVRVLPVSGVISEGGGIFLRPHEGRIQYEFFASERAMRTHQKALLTQLEVCLKRYPCLTFTKDQAYRLTDVAIDYAQDIRPPAVVERDAFLVELHAMGLNAKTSSIHINVCPAGVDKFAMAKRVLSTFLDVSPQAFCREVLYVGDAPNDESMFAQFPLSIGVANIAPHLASLRHMPRYVTEAEGGLGFVELADHLLLKQ